MVDWKGSITLANYGRVGENDDTIKRSIIRSIVHSLRKEVNWRSRSECLDLRLCLERLLL